MDNDLFYIFRLRMFRDPRSIKKGLNSTLLDALFSSQLLLRMTHCGALSTTRFA